MTTPKKNSLLDPDYELTEVAREHIKTKENAENRETLEKIIDIINREFKTEMDHRQSQLDLIQQRLNKAQKTLHLLRYVLINTYYNDQNLYVRHQEDLHTEDNLISNKNRIHPAVKNVMLGLNSNDYKLNITKSPRKKMKYIDSTNVNASSETLTLDNEVYDKTVISDCKDEDIKPSNFSVSPQKEEYDMIRNRKKTKYRIVVGNISKWMPSESEEDKSTHKWMVYVRGSKENPDISHFVEKVVFYLHPSYQPNDVVELRHPPFHLSRRGWGEFPLRVKIFFQYTLNKPVDIIHNLKLDKTFTGQQTLGNETIVNLFLYKKEKKALDNDIQIPPIKQEVPDDLLENEINTNLNSGTDVDMHNYTEHDYCSVGLGQEVIKDESNSQRYDFYKEHSYARTGDSNKTDSVSNEEQRNHLIHGINDAEINKCDAVEGTVVNETKMNDCRTILPNNATVIAVKKIRRPQESLLRKGINKNSSHTPDRTNNRLIVLHSLQSSSDSKISLANTVFVPINYKKYQIRLPKNRFKTTREALPYLFKRMPLITDLASNLDYKCTFPYVAKSLQEYSSWNIGKRLSAEWYRAKMVLKIIRDENLKNSENYSPKVLIMYARSHGYTPLANYEIFKNSNCLNAIIDSENEGTSNLNKLDLSKITDLEDVVVDVISAESDENNVNTPSHKIKLIDQKAEGACSFIRQVVLDAGVILKPQEIIPGVIFNGAERMLLQALLCLAEDLIRKARTNLVCKGNFEEEKSVINIEDVYKAISQRPQFKFLLKLDMNSD
ncbi:hypothetical protein FQR65_LT09508 [Abscondita terminalis]|nr:hypothetical protein FQR65_LT09508 [Abscondita terminalis]